MVGDHDWIRIELTAGQSISVALNGLTLSDPYLRIRDASGNILFENDDSGASLNSLLAFTASYSGTYFIDVGAYDDSSAGTYEVSVSPYAPPPLASIHQVADQLVSGFWDGDSRHFAVSAGGALTVNLSGLTAAGQELARAALITWTDIIGVRFNEVLTGGQILFDDVGEGAYSESISSGGIISSAQVNVSTQWLTQYGTGLNGYSFQTYIHEIGHALGLGHSGDYNDSARYPFDAKFQNDSWSISVMSYFDQQENSYFASQGFNKNYIVTPMMADILAMSVLYGLSTTTRAGDTVYGPGWTTDMGALTIFDSGGNDTIDVSGLIGNHRIDLNPGTFSNVLGEVGNVGIALGVIIENAIGGAGNDTLLGNNADNRLSGGAGVDSLFGGGGNDFLDGGSGADTLAGGLGNDIYIVDVNTDIVQEDASDVGIDTVRSSAASFVLGQNVENLELTGSSLSNGFGNELSNLITGNQGNNILRGEGGNDTLLGREGADFLVGGAGNDILDGGTGLDTAMFSELFRSYSVNMKGANGTVSGPKEGIDSLTSIEVIQFKDGKFVFDVDGVAAQVTRLYDTVLDRAPDQAGLDLWVDRLEGQIGTLKDVANGFLNSAEFQAKTGSLSNADYVEFLYQNALGRASDPDGKNYWVGTLSSGLDRADLLIGFSESPEHRGLTAELVAKGFFNTDDAYQAVALLYDSFAGRLPDAAGLIVWAEAIKSGAMTLAQVAAGFANSAEFQNLTAGMSHSQLVDFMYQNSLDRGADPAGKQAWVNLLDAGLSDGDLLIGFSQSTEHFFLLGSHITNGIDYF